MFFQPLLQGALQRWQTRGARKWFVARPRSAAAARRFVLASVPGYDDGDRRLATLVSELATNAIVHAGTPFSVRVEQDASRIRVSVSDQSPKAPTRRAVEPSSPAGRGLYVIEAYADRWGYSPEGDGKKVWFEIDRPAPESA